MTGKGFFFCLYERNAAFLLTRPYFGNAKIGNLWGQIRAFGTQNIPSFAPKLCHFWRKTLLFMLQNMLSFRLEVRIRRAGSRHLPGKVLTATTESLNCLLPASPLLAFQGCGGCFRRVRFFYFNCQYFAIALSVSRLRNFVAKKTADASLGPKYGILGALGNQSVRMSKPRLRAYSAFRSACFSHWSKNFSVSSCMARLKKCFSSQRRVTRRSPACWLSHACRMMP